jgi:hypothetical protein
MDSRPTTADSKHTYYPPSPHLWSRSSSSPAVPRLSTINTTADALPATRLPAHLELLPILFPQRSLLHQAQLLQYNKLIAPARGGRLQTQPLPPLLSAQNAQIGGRSRSSSKVSNSKETRAKPGTQNCHGNRGTQKSDKGDRTLITSAKMPPKRGELSHPLPSRPPPITQPSTASIAQSNSVPSTPHQHARKFSFESREPSPNAVPSHSPRSAYSETNSTLPSLRPLPPRFSNCPFETPPERSRRRMPYSGGNERLSKVDLSTIKQKLSNEEETKLSAEIETLYQRLLPTQEVEGKRKRLVQKLEKLLNRAWPGHDIQVHLFGSSGNLLCSDDSDGKSAFQPCPSSVC